MARGKRVAGTKPIGGRREPAGGGDPAGGLSPGRGTCAPGETKPMGSGTRFGGTKPIRYGVLSGEGWNSWRNEANFPADAAAAPPGLSARLHASTRQTAIQGFFSLIDWRNWKYKFVSAVTGSPESARGPSRFGIGIAPAVPTPPDDGTADRADDDPERARDEDADERPLIGVRRQDQGTHEADQEATEPEDERTETCRRKDLSQ